MFVCLFQDDPDDCGEVKNEESEDDDDEGGMDTGYGGTLSTSVSSS